MFDLHEMSTTCTDDHRKPLPLFQPDEPWVTGTRGDTRQVPCLPAYVVWRAAPPSEQVQPSNVTKPFMMSSLTQTMQCCS